MEQGEKGSFIYHSQILEMLLFKGLQHPETPVSMVTGDAGRRNPPSNFSRLGLPLKYSKTQHMIGQLNGKGIKDSWFVNDTTGTPP